MRDADYCSFELNPSVRRTSSSEEILLSLVVREEVLSSQIGKTTVWHLLTMLLPPPIGMVMCINVYSVQAQRFSTEDFTEPRLDRLAQVASSVRAI